MLADLNVGIGDSHAPHFTEFNGNVSFAAASSYFGAELFVTDGTLGGTHIQKDILGRPVYGGGFEMPTVLGGKLFFIAETFANGKELWATDGTNANTKFFADIRPGNQSAISSYQKSVIYNNFISQQMMVHMVMSYGIVMAALPEQI